MYVTVMIIQTFIINLHNCNRHDLLVKKFNHIKMYTYLTFKMML